MTYYRNGNTMYPIEVEYIAPCPQCGKQPSQKYGIRTIPKSAAVCCGGENCRYFVVDSTVEKAVKKWNDIAKGECLQ